MVGLGLGSLVVLPLQTRATGGPYTLLKRVAAGFFGGELKVNYRCPHRVTPKLSRVCTRLETRPSPPASPTVRRRDVARSKRMWECGRARVTQTAPELATAATSDYTNQRRTASAPLRTHSASAATGSLLERGRDEQSDPRSCHPFDGAARARTHRVRHRRQPCRGHVRHAMALCPSGRALWCGPALRCEDAVAVAALVSATPRTGDED